MASPPMTPNVADSTMSESAPATVSTTDTGPIEKPTPGQGTEHDMSENNPSPPLASQASMDRINRKHLLSPSSAAHQGPNQAPPQAARSAPGRYAQPLLFPPNIQTPSPSGSHAQPIDDPFTVLPPASRNKPNNPEPLSYIPNVDNRPARTPAPADALPPSHPSQDHPSNPQDGRENMNFLDLGTLTDFIAHGTRPSTLLENLDKDRLITWLADPGAILALPLDAKYSGPAAQEFQNNLSEHLTRAFPSSAATIEVQPPIQHGHPNPKDTRPWGFLIQGLSKGQADTLTLTCGHLWLSQRIGFIAIKLHMYSPSQYVVAIKEMYVNLDKASEVTTAIITQMTTPKTPIHNTLKELGVSQERLTEMINGCRAVPRGYTIDRKESPSNIKEKRNPTSNSSITLWEIYIPPPYKTIVDTTPGQNTPHDSWIRSFCLTYFQSPKSSRGSAITSPRTCFTCKATDHTYLLCPIHDHHAWHLQHPDFTEETTETEEQASTAPPQLPVRSGRPSRPFRHGRGNNPHA